MDRTEFMDRLDRATTRLDRANMGDTKKRIVNTLQAGLKAEAKNPGTFEIRLHTMPKCGSGGWMIAVFFMNLMSNEDMFVASRKAQQAYQKRYGQGNELPHIDGLMLAFHILGTIGMQGRMTTLDKMQQSSQILKMIGSPDPGVRSMAVLLDAFVEPL